MIVASHLRDAAAGGGPDPQPQDPQRRPRRGGADGDRRPGDADPRGPGAADERHLRGRGGAAGQTRHPGPADERHREPRRGRHDLRRQDRHPDRRRAAPDRGRVRRRASTRPPAQAALGRFAASAGDRNRTLETIAERFPGEAGRVSAEVPFSSEWKWSGLALAGGGGVDLRARRAGRPRRGRRADPAAGPGRASSRRRPRPGAASSPSASRRARCRPTRPPRRRRG